ncbi:hypothetical protein LINPERHAP1_LOCUS9675, partial [Linum perenne]
NQAPRFHSETYQNFLPSLHSLCNPSVPPPPVFRQPPFVRPPPSARPPPASCPSTTSNRESTHQLNLDVFVLLLIVLVVFFPTRILGNWTV